jgi:hypothetical protein
VAFLAAECQNLQLLAGISCTRGEAFHWRVHRTEDANPCRARLCRFARRWRQEVASLKRLDFRLGGSPQDLTARLSRFKSCPHMNGVQYIVTRLPQPSSLLAGPHCNHSRYSIVLYHDRKRQVRRVCLIPPTTNTPTRTPT